MTNYAYPSPYLAPLYTHIRLQLRLLRTPTGKVTGAIVNTRDLAKLVDWTPQRVEEGLDRLQELGLFAKWRYDEKKLWKLEVIDPHRVRPISPTCRRGHERTPKTIRLDTFARIVCTVCKAKTMPRAGRAYRQRRGDVPCVREAVCSRGHNMGIDSIHTYRVFDGITMTCSMCLVCSRANNRLIQRFKRANLTALKHDRPTRPAHPTRREIDAEVAAWDARHAAPLASIYLTTPPPCGLVPAEQRVFDHLRARRGLWVNVRRLRASVGMVATESYAASILSSLRRKLAGSAWSVEDTHDSSGMYYRRLRIDETALAQAA